MNKGARRALAAAALGAVSLAGALAVATLADLQDFADGLDVGARAPLKARVLARDGTPLNLSLQDPWNLSDVVALGAVPGFLRDAFVVSEDGRFYRHHGVDWRARLAALWQDLRAPAAVRGASTITEQVVRMLHPRPRTLWSRWLEGFEAARLEDRYGKAALLAFYLNQVPYAERRRGVVQAARYYYGRDFDTLTPAEMLSLAVFVRSPRGLDPRRNAQRLRRAVDDLARRMVRAGKMSAGDLQTVATTPLALSPDRLPLDAGYFVTRVLQAQGPPQGAAAPRTVVSTLDPWLQGRAQQLMNTALDQLARRKVGDGALLVIDNERNEVLAWVVARARSALVDPGDQGLGFDAVLVPRQPGSTMKPLLYAMALEQGWTAATLIDDDELAEGVGVGQHSFRNYSRTHYGPIRLREALGNSLNVPAVRTLKYVGVDRFLERLHLLGVAGLRRGPSFYGDGLALGNGEVSLYEMAQAYTALARRGRFRPLRLVIDDGQGPPQAQAAPGGELAAYRPEVVALIADILSDPDARALEFGRGLQFPVQTAIKTGTSSDYRDAWAIAYDYRHTVAAWMGNLDDRPMDGVTGAMGPGMVLRSVFSELNRNQQTRGLWFSRKLVPAGICRRTGLPASAGCERLTEWFVPGTEPHPAAAPASRAPLRIAQPTPGLQVAHDPRIPPEFEALPMSIEPVPGLVKVRWIVDGVAVSEAPSPKFDWPLHHGPHEVTALVWAGDAARPRATEPVQFMVR